MYCEITVRVHVLIYPTTNTTRPWTISITFLGRVASLVVRA